MNPLLSNYYILIFIGFATFTAFKVIDMTSFIVLRIVSLKFNIESKAFVSSFDSQKRTKVIRSQVKRLW